jgi:hypothetical protein
MSSTAASDHALRLVGAGGSEHSNALRLFVEEIQQAEDELIHKIEKPSLTEIFNALDSATGWAEAFSKRQPEYNEAADRCVQSLRQIGLELQTACRMDTHSESSRQAITTDAALYDVVACLTRARAYASFVSERQLEHTIPLRRFRDGVQRIQLELVENVDSVYIQRRMQDSEAGARAKGGENLDCHELSRKDCRTL